MSHRNKLRRPQMIKHRELMIVNAIADLADGKGSTNYASERARKLKEIRGGH